MAGGQTYRSATVSTKLIVKRNVDGDMEVSVIFPVKIFGLEVYVYSSDGYYDLITAFDESMNGMDVVAKVDYRISNEDDVRVIKQIAGMPPPVSEALVEDLGWVEAEESPVYAYVKCPRTKIAVVKAQTWYNKIVDRGISYVSTAAKAVKNWFVSIVFGGQ